MKSISLLIFILFSSSALSSSEAIRFHKFTQSVLFEKVQEHLQGLKLEAIGLGVQNSYLSFQELHSLYKWISTDMTIQEKDQLVSYGFLYKISKKEARFSGGLSFSIMRMGLLTRRGIFDDYSINDYYLQRMIGIPELGLDGYAETTFKNLTSQMKHQYMSPRKILSEILHMSYSNVQKVIDEGVLVKSKIRKKRFAPYVYFEGDLYIISESRFREIVGITLEELTVKIRAEDLSFEESIKKIRSMSDAEREKAVKKGVLEKFDYDFSKKSPSIIFKKLIVDQNKFFYKFSESEWNKIKNTFYEKSNSCRAFFNPYGGALVRSTSTGTAKFSL